MSQPNAAIEIKLNEISVSLNAHEMGILLYAIQNLENIDEIRLSREFGSASALYNKLYSYWEQLDTSQTGLRYDVVPSF
jgi:hypothetical protein